MLAKLVPTLHCFTYSSNRRFTFLLVAALALLLPHSFPCHFLQEPATKCRQQLTSYESNKLQLSNVPSTINL